MLKWKCKVLLAAVIVVGVLAGCSGSQRQAAVPVSADGTVSAADQAAAEETEEADTAESAVSADVFTIGYAWAGGNSAWHEANIENYRDIFCSDNGYELTIVDCANDNGTQLEAVQEFVTQQMDYIIADPVDGAGWDAVLKEAQRVGVPVIIVDREVDIDASMYDAWVGSGRKNGGITAGNWLAEYLDGREAGIAVIESNEDVYTASARMEGFQEIAKEHSEWKILKSQTGDATREGGRKTMESFIRLYNGQLDVVVCQNDDQAYGSMDAMDAAGITYGTGGDVIIISFGGTHEGLQYTLDGKINCSIEHNPIQAETVEEVIREMAEGTEHEEAVFVNEEAFTAPEIKSEYAVTITEDILASRTY